MIPVSVKFNESKCKKLMYNYLSCLNKPTKYKNCPDILDEYYKLNCSMPYILTLDKFKNKQKK